MSFPNSAATNWPATSAAQKLSAPRLPVFVIKGAGGNRELVTQVSPQEASSLMASAARCWAGTVSDQSFPWAMNMSRCFFMWEAKLGAS